MPETTPTRIQLTIQKLTIDHRITCGDCHRNSGQVANVERWISQHMADYHTIWNWLQS